MAIFNPNWAGSFSVRLLGTRYLKNYTDNTLTAPIDTAGENSGDGPAEWRWNASLTYNLEPFSGTLAARGVSSGVYDNAMIECTVGCPTATIDHQTINENDIDGAVYFDLSLNYTFMLGNGDSNMEAFFNIKNIFNKDPVIVAGG